MRYAHLVARFTSEPWFIDPATLQGLANLLTARLEGAAVEPAAGEHDDAGEVPASPLDSLAIVTANGVFGQHLSLMESACGAVSYERLVARVQAAAADPAIKTIVLWLNSRGGTCAGCTEAFTRLLEIKAASGKPLIAFCDSVCGSAAFYLAAACDAIICTPTARLGCIGSILSYDVTAAKSVKDGIQRFTFKTASMKDLGTPDRVPTPAETDQLQAMVDTYGRLFVADMRATRPQITEEVYEKGLVYIGQQAVAAGLADEVMPDFQAFLESLLANLPAAAPATA